MNFFFRFTLYKTLEDNLQPSAWVNNWLGHYWFSLLQHPISWDGRSASMSCSRTRSSHWAVGAEDNSEVRTRRRLRSSISLNIGIFVIEGTKYLHAVPISNPGARLAIKHPKFSYTNRDLEHEDYLGSYLWSTDIPNSKSSSIPR